MYNCDQPGTRHLRQSQPVDKGTRKILAWDWSRFLAVIKSEVREPRNTPFTWFGVCNIIL